MPTMPFYTLQIGQNFTPENVVPMRTGSLPREAVKTHPFAGFPAFFRYDCTCFSRTGRIGTGLFLISVFGSLTSPHQTFLVTYKSPSLKSSQHSPPQSRLCPIRCTPRCSKPVVLSQRGTKLFDTPRPTNMRVCPVEVSPLAVSIPELDLLHHNVPSVVPTNKCQK